jgi:hypothetical protein
MSREEFLIELAKQIQVQAEQHPTDSSEPYRAAGDQLVDLALDLID